MEFCDHRTAMRKRNLQDEWNCNGQMVFMLIPLKLRRGPKELRGKTDLSICHGQLLPIGSTCRVFLMKRLRLTIVHEILRACRQLP